MYIVIKRQIQTFGYVSLSQKSVLTAGFVSECVIICVKSGADTEKL